MRAGDSEDKQAAGKPIGLPESLRGELGDAPPRRRPARQSKGLIHVVPGPPEEGEALPGWAIVFLTGTALLAAGWLAVMVASALRVLGWI